MSRHIHRDHAPKKVVTLPPAPPATEEVGGGDVDDTILCCSICMENYVAAGVSSNRSRNPKLLNCLHTFCRGCLAATLENDVITCPKCFTLTSIRGVLGGVDGLRDDFSIQHLLEMSVDFSDGNYRAPLCGNCEDGYPTAWGCLNCLDNSTNNFGVPLCESCFVNHGRVKQFKVHEVLPLDQYLPRIAMQRKNQPVKCATHPAKDIEFCCETCHAPVCPQCVVTGVHSGHRMQSLTDAAEKQRAILRGQVTAVDTAVAALAANKTELLERVRFFDDNVTTVHSNVDAEINELIEMLEIRRQHAHDEIEARASGKLRRAKAKLETLGIQIVTARQVNEFVERGVHYGSDIDVYEVGPALLRSLRLCLESADAIASEDSLQFDSISLAVASTKEQMRQLIGSLCFVQQSAPSVLPNERRAGIIGAGVGSGPGELLNPHGIVLLMPIAGLTSDPWIFVNDRTNNRIQVFNAVTGAYLRTIGRGAGSGPGQLNGAYGLALLIPAEEFQGSPNPLLFVADYGNHRVQVFDCITTEFLYIIGAGNGSAFGQFNGPFRMAIEMPEPGTTYNPLLFVTDYGNHRVQVFDAVNGEFVHSIGTNVGFGPGQFNGPLGISLHQSPTGGATLLFVGDNGNNRVQVFNAITGTYIREIGSGGGAHPGQFNGIYGLAVQPANARANGMLYIADFSNHRIQVFDALTGELNRVIGAGMGNILSQLYFPSDVILQPRLDGSMVMFVAEQTNNRVQVFVFND